MTLQLQPEHSPGSKPARMTEASSAPSPAPWGWDLCPLSSNCVPPPQQRGGPLTPQLALLTTQSRGKSQQHRSHSKTTVHSRGTSPQPACFGVCTCRAEWLSEDLLPPH